MFVNAGAGAPGAAQASAVYVFESSAMRSERNAANTPKLVDAREGEVDAHGVAVTEDARYLLVGDRAQNDITVVDTTTDQVVNRFSPVGAASGDPAPEPVRSVTGWQRGLCIPARHDAAERWPRRRRSNARIGVVQLTAEGTYGRLVGVAPARRNDGKLPDTHAISVRPLVP